MWLRLKEKEKAIEPFDSEIYFVVDEKEIVEPIVNYFSEKILEEEVSGLFYWILKNTLPEDCHAIFKAEEKFLIVSVDNLRKLDKDFVKQFHNVCVYKGNFSLTFSDVKEIYNSKKPRAIFYFEDKFDLNKFIELQGRFYTTVGNSYSGVEMSVNYDRLVTNDYQILNIKFNPNAGYMYAEEILTSEMSDVREILSEVEKILSDSETNLFLKSYYALKDMFVDKICRKHQLQVFYDDFSEVTGYEFQAGYIIDMASKVSICYRNEVVYPGKMIQYTLADGRKMNFDINQEFGVHFPHFSVEFSQKISDIGIGPKSFEKCWNRQKRIDFEVKNFQEMGKMLSEPSKICSLNDNSSPLPFDNSIEIQVHTKIKKLLSDSSSFEKILCDIEKILSSSDASEEYWLDIEKNFFKEFPEELPEELKKFLETW